jgi:hypothetical protein
MIHLATIDLMARRLTGGEATSSWRDPTAPRSNTNSGIKHREEMTFQ